MLEPLLRMFAEEFETLLIPKRDRHQDPYKLCQTRDGPPALGHFFDEKLCCDCGRDWQTHQTDPHVCPILLRRLKELECLDSQIRIVERRYLKKLRKVEVDLAAERVTTRKLGIEVKVLRETYEKRKPVRPPKNESNNESVEQDPCTSRRYAPEQFEDDEQDRESILSGGAASKNG